jgi:hypothetical protein
MDDKDIEEALDLASLEQLEKAIMSRWEVAVFAGKNAVTVDGHKVASHVISQGDPIAALGLCSLGQQAIFRELS